MSQSKREWRDVKRQAGCLWGCLSEPFMLVVLALAAALGLYKLTRKAERPRPDQDQTEDQTSDD